MSRNSEFTEAVDRGIGAKVTKLRIAHGMSRQQLGEKIGVTHQQLQKYERGVNRLTAGRLVAIAKAFGKPVSYFFEDYAIEEVMPTLHRRMCIEVSRNFMNIADPGDQQAVNLLVKSLARGRK